VKKIMLCSFFIFFTLCSNIYASLPDPGFFLDAMESNDTKTLTTLFDLNNEKVSSSEVEIFIIQLTDEIEKRYGISVDLQAVKNNITTLISENNSYKELLKESDKINMELESRGKYFMEFLLKLSGLDFRRKVIDKKINASQYFCREPGDIPDGFEISYCEILAGVLICILPIPGSQSVGTFIIGDGIRRAFIKIEKDNEEKKMTTNNNEKDNAGEKEKTRKLR
jgi:hypothetical protein